MASCELSVPSSRIVHMFASQSAPVDPEPLAGQRDLAERDWQESWDYLSVATAEDDWDPGEEVDLDGELHALLDSLHRVEPVEPAEDAALVAVLAELAQRTEVALSVASTAVAVAPLSEWSDAAIVAEAARVERLVPVGHRPGL